MILHMVQYTVCRTEYGGVVARGMTTAMSEMKQAARGAAREVRSWSGRRLWRMGAHMMFVEWTVRPSSAGSPGRKNVGLGERGAAAAAAGEGGDIGDIVGGCGERGWALCCSQVQSDRRRGVQGGWSRVLGSCALRVRARAERALFRFGYVYTDGIDREIDR